jgi:hypothetical protein
MNPQQPDYSFIMQGGNNKKPQLLAPKSQKQRIMIVGFIGFSLLLIGIVIMILLSAFGTNNAKKLTDLAVQQNEFQLILEIGAKDAGNGTLRNISQIAASSLATQKQNTLKLASDKNIKIADKQLVTLNSKKITEELDKAKNNNSFDEVFLSIYNSQLTSYNKNLRELSSSEKDSKIKFAVDSYIKNISVLLSNAE